MNTLDLQPTQQVLTVRNICTPPRRHIPGPVDAALPALLGPPRYAGKCRGVYFFPSAVGASHLPELASVPHQAERGEVLSGSGQEVSWLSSYGEVEGTPRAARALGGRKTTRLGLLNGAERGRTTRTLAAGGKRGTLGTRGDEAETGGVVRKRQAVFKRLTARAQMKPPPPPPPPTPPPPPPPPPSPHHSNPHT